MTPPIAQPHNRSDDLDVQAVADLDSDDFWTATQVLSDCRQFARARLVGPYAMLGNVLTLATSTIPPNVVLPPSRGSEVGLNLFVALVGPSGASKSASNAVARDWITCKPQVVNSKPGSGEGLAKCFAYVQMKPSPPTQCGKAWSVLAFVPEVSTLIATGGRNGSTMMSEFRSGWTGERLGHDYADSSKRIILEEYRYRLCYVIGVQPTLAKFLFDQSGEGTPQRLLWMPTSDPNVPNHRVIESAPHKLDAWPAPIKGPNRILADTNIAREALLNVPIDKATLEVLQIPEFVREEIEAEARIGLRRGLTEDTEHGHRLLSQLKVAASLMWLHKRHDGITELDWQLAGHLMNVSDRLRHDTQSIISDSFTKRERIKAVSRGIMEDVAESTKEQQAIDRLATNIVTHLKADGSPMSMNELKKRFHSRYRLFFEPALSKLLDNKTIHVYPSMNKGPSGMLVELIDRD